MLCIEISRPHNKPFLLSAWYRARNTPIKAYNSLDNFLQKYDAEEKLLVVMVVYVLESSWLVPPCVL